MTERQRFVSSMPASAARKKSRSASVGLNQKRWRTSIAPRAGRGAFAPPARTRRSGRTAPRRCAGCRRRAPPRADRRRRAAAARAPARRSTSRREVVGDHEERDRLAALAGARAPRRSSRPRAAAGSSRSPGRLLDEPARRRRLRSGRAPPTARSRARSRARRRSSSSIMIGCTSTTPRKVGSWRRTPRLLVGDREDVRTQAARPRALMRALLHASASDRRSGAPPKTRARRARAAGRSGPRRAGRSRG